MVSTRLSGLSASSAASDVNKREREGELIGWKWVKTAIICLEMSKNTGTLCIKSTLVSMLAFGKIVWKDLDAADVGLGAV